MEELFEHWHKITTICDHWDNLIVAARASCSSEQATFAVKQCMYQLRWCFRLLLQVRCTSRIALAFASKALVEDHSS